MQTLFYEVDSDGVVIPIGRVGENEVTQVVFDVSSYIETYGSGTVELVHRRKRDSVGYVCENVTLADGAVTWVVTSDDTGYLGQGKLQVRWYVDDALKKSAVFNTMTGASVTSTGSAPQEVRDALELILDYVNDNTISIEDLDERIANYFDEHPIPAPVTSVNELTGDVVITPELLEVYTQDEVDALAYGAYPYDTASGSVASFPDGAELPVKDLIIAIKPAQDGSGDPSPTNVRAISGWTGANVTVNSDTIAFDWSSEAGTIYGGTLDLTTGLLTVTHVYTTLTSSDLSTAGHASTGVYYVTTGIFSDLLGSGYVYSDRYISTTGTSINNAIRALGNKRFGIYDNRFTDLDTAKSLIGEVQVVYPLATPTTYQLTAQEISTLLGTNNIYADCGDITVTYRADPTLYIAKLTGSTEDDFTADSNITSGSYFMIGNTLYIATTAIASGEAIVEGTNCTKTDLASALNALNA